MRFTDYDAMAWLYATRWGTEYHEHAHAVLRRALLDGLRPGASILDLCCGDGRLAEVLRGDGYEVTGLDGSERMLEYARARLPGARLVLADARWFTLDRKFDAVISTFDSLNHVMSGEDLLAVFRSVEGALKQDGVFVFDMNREEAYASLSPDKEAIVEPELVMVYRGSYDAAERVAEADFTVFRAERGSWTRSDFRMRQRYHPAVEIEKSLQAAGFSHVVTLDAARDLGMPDTIGQGRNYYIAKR